MNTQALVITSVVTTGIVATVGSFAQGKRPTVRMGIGLLFAGTVLAVGAETVPSLAAGFATLMLVSSLAVYGGPAWTGINNALGKGQK